ncbi:M18 family aminopeptidase [Streptomyces laurentii]|uniref:M18 family aminopeptidase n=1 Tax=Streptomyces laurentii TaxID=39478 RepID=A0A160P717_STRLU|nr:M18 family aminopeptidase [Streptomyces laurentii]
MRTKGVYGDGTRAGVNAEGRARKDARKCARACERCVRVCESVVYAAVLPCGKATDPVPGSRLKYRTDKQPQRLRHQAVVGSAGGGPLT